MRLKQPICLIYSNNKKQYQGIIKKDKKHIFKFYNTIADTIFRSNRTGPYNCNQSKQQQGFDQYLQQEKGRTVTMSSNNPSANASSGISIQHRNAQAAPGSAASGHHEGGSALKHPQGAQSKTSGGTSSSATGLGSNVKRRQAQESSGQGQANQSLQNGANASGMNQSAGAGGHAAAVGRKAGQKQMQGGMQGGASMVSPQKKGLGIGNERAPGTAAGASKADMSLQNADGPVRPGAGGGANAEASLFNKHYNKELKLCEDEIPMVLCELNESAMAYLGRDQFDNALLLLQKAHGVLDVVDLSGSRRDQFIAFQLFHNMAMCYQKQGQLEECALCLETTLDHLGSDYASEKNQSLAVRIYKLKLEARLRLQFCAILSQLHRHKEALEQAQEGIKIAHLIVRDKISACRFYSKRIDYQETYGTAAEEQQHGSSRGNDRSESQSRSEATASKHPSGVKARLGERRPSARKKAGEHSALDDQSKSSFPFDEDLQAGQFQHGLKFYDDVSTDSIGNFQTEQAILNNLDGSISLIEKTSKKLLPIYKALLEKVSQIERKKEAVRKGKDQEDRTKHDISHNDFESSDDSRNEGDKSGKGKKSPGRPKSAAKGKKPGNQKRGVLNVDLRHILGFLNQTEWIQNLNIGNIMQIGPLKLEDLTQMRRNEECLSRDSFLEVISFLIVGYFCASTEIRFIIQLKDEISKFENFSIEKKTQESELWHTMSLDIACSFLPSDCPLLNHILLSYQKHHAPSQSQIPENAAVDEKLRVIKPHYGIDNSKFQPIIRALGGVKIDLPLSRIPPAQKRVTKMLKDIQARHLHAQEKSLALSKQVQGGNSNTPVAQQAQRDSQLSPKKKLSNFQALKLLKLEKIVAKFSKDVGYDKNQILRFLLGDQYHENAGDLRKGEMNLDGRYPLGAHSGLPSGRPQSHKESLGSRSNLEAGSANTGMAAKLAYNNMRKYGEQDVITQNLVTNHSQASMKSAGSQNWRMSPQSYVESRNGKQFPNQGDNHFDQERLSAGNGEPASHAVPLRPQGQNQGEKRLYDSESSHRDSSFLNDLSQVHVNHHDKSFNEQLDERSKFILNQSDMNMEFQQHHNFSIGAIGNGAGQSHGGTVRQNSKRVHSHERGKIQRPRSSKGYRGAQHANQSQTQAHSHANSNGTSNIGGQSMQHQMSAHHLHAGGLGSLQNSSSLNANNAGQQKFHTTKSEERALKTQQNQRSLVNKNQRQKTAGAGGHAAASHNASSHTSHGFNKDPLGSGMQSKKLASLNSQLQSQSSTQLPSAQATGNLQKLTKKQIQQIQQHQAQQASGMAQHPATLSNAASTSQLQSAALTNNLVQYSSLNAGGKNSKMKLNYDDLKKFLIKEQNSAQVQQLLQQHAALGHINPNNSQSQSSFAGASNQLGHVDAGGLLQSQEGGGRGRSQPGGKGKKMAASSQNQLTAMQGLQNQQKLNNMQSAQSLEKLEQIQVSLDDGNNQSVSYQTSNNRDIKEIMYTNSETAKGEGQPSQVHYSTQQKKAKQIIAQARKATGGGGGHAQHGNTQFQQVPVAISSQQTHQTAQQAQQIYLNSLPPHGQGRPNSSHKYNMNAGNPQRASHNQLVNHREANSKSALATVGKHQTVSAAAPGQVQAGQNQNQGAANGSASIKRREKGRLIMQEWLTKSGQNVSSQSQLQNMQAAQNAGQHAQLLAAQAAQIAAHNGHQAPSSHPHTATTGKTKFVQKQLGGFDLGAGQVSLTKQQQQQLQQIQLAKQNMAHGLDRSVSQQNNLNVNGANDGTLSAGASTSIGTSIEGRRKSQPM